ncbi:MAG: hypothetical protein KKD39_00400 [Candidatus Altiarchaeota archaeon]|nr:hypothetical protein [Candidatus Altiarchaeota archaeon]
MTVFNFKIKRLSGEKTKTDVSNIEIKANSVIQSAKKAKDKRIGEYLHVNFKYTAEYLPDVGKIEIEGTLWYQNPKFSTVVSEVKDKIEITNEAMSEISNAIIVDSMIEALSLSRKLQLAPPMQMPSVTVKGDVYKFPKEK